MNKTIVVEELTKEETIPAYKLMQRAASSKVKVHISNFTRTNADKPLSKRDKHRIEVKGRKML